MEENDKMKKLIEKWKEFEENGPDKTNTDSNVEFPTLLPIAIKVAAKTISNDLIFASEEEIDEVKNKVLSENRDGKIEAIIEDKPFVEKKLEDDEEYQKLMKKGVTPLPAPKGHLFYLDFKYGDDKKEGE